MYISNVHILHIAYFLLLNMIEMMITSAQISQILRKLVKSALKLDKSNEKYSNCYLN